MAYDVATMLAVPWHAAPRVYGWAELCNFAAHAAADERTATWRALNPEAATWASRVGEVTALALVHDAVAAVLHALGRRWAPKGHAPKEPRPFPLPWLRGDDRERSFGRDPIAVADFDAWYYDER